MEGIQGAHAVAQVLGITLDSELNIAQIKKKIFHAWVREETTQMSFNLHDKVLPLFLYDRMPLRAISENYLNNVMS